ncbi:hypothetical protein QVD17_32519 [Tagetes erecta]|uniref:Uncharacterized protein n=1 Tax=Tagetes erecta TaxID=13708 RepID=A0AAD8NK09_TARER|nr:hypothetical protein QVD17_32519 [Tagetes erecta]
MSTNAGTARDPAARRIGFFRILLWIIRDYFEVSFALRLCGSLEAGSSSSVQVSRSAGMLRLSDERCSSVVDGSGSVVVGDGVDGSESLLYANYVDLGGCTKVSYHPTKLIYSFTFDFGWIFAHKRDTPNSSSSFQSTHHTASNLAVTSDGGNHVGVVRIGSLDTSIMLKYIMKYFASVKSLASVIHLHYYVRFRAVLAGIRLQINLVLLWQLQCCAFGIVLAAVRLQIWSYFDSNKVVLLEPFLTPIYLHRQVLLM